MKSNPGNRIKYYLELSKLKIMLPVSFTGFTGYFIFNPHLSVEILLITFGILLMAIAASVLNQIQEERTDSLMDRTKNRPIPSGEITFPKAIIFFFFNLAAGTAIIFIWGSLNAVLVGLFTIFWYNAVYTYSKKITAFAVVPGALTGALPPLIGWVAAGGGLWDKPIVFIGFLLFTGQIPHFWLLILRYGEEYKKAGFPGLTDLFSHAQIKRLTFTWVVTSVIAAIFLCYFEIISTALIIGILIIASAFLIRDFSKLLKTQKEKSNLRKYSIILDLYYLLVLILLILDRIIA
jgi:protoheme IX farnesyltransferase